MSSGFQPGGFQHPGYQVEAGGGVTASITQSLVISQSAVVRLPRLAGGAPRRRVGGLVTQELVIHQSARVRVHDDDLVLELL